MSATYFLLDKARRNNSKLNTLHGAVIEQRSEGSNTNDDEGKEHGGNFNTVGFIGRGYHTSQLTWAKSQPKFFIGGNAKETSNKQIATYASIERSPKNLLVVHPVELLVVDSVHTGDYRTTKVNKKGSSKWLDQVQHTQGKSHGPRVVVESWTGEDILNEDEGPTSKRHRVLWEQAGYITRIHRWEASELNGAMTQERLIVLRLAPSLRCNIEWAQKSNLPPER
jgi:hypothetical protein